MDLDGRVYPERRHSELRNDQNKHEWRFLVCSGERCLNCKFQCRYKRPGDRRVVLIMELIIEWLVSTDTEGDTILAKLGRHEEAEI